MVIPSNTTASLFVKLFVIHRTQIILFILPIIFPYYCSTADSRKVQKEAGIPLATIAVDPENDTAYRLYLKNGFSKNGLITVFGTTYDRLERKA